jgi:hypothetical protein
MKAPPGLAMNGVQTARPLVAIAAWLTAMAIPAGVSPVAASASIAMYVAAGSQPGRLTAGLVQYEPTGPRVGKIRVANFYVLPNGKTGPALDFYDTSQPSKSDKPLIADLKYGQISAYVSPRSGGPLSDYGNLYVFPAGSKKAGPKVDAVQAGTNISNAGWLAGEQQTIVLGSGAQFGGTVSLSPVDEVEPAKIGHSALVKPPHGQGLLAVNQTALVEMTPKYGGIEIRLDGRCDRKSVQMANVDNYFLTFGTHTMNVVPDPAPGTGLGEQQCEKSRPVVTVTLKVSKSAPTIAFIYGANPSRAKVLVTTVG